MGAWLAKLVSSDETVADSIVIGGLIALLVLCGMSIYSGASLWNPISFGTGATAIIGAIGGARRLRDGPGGQQQ